MKLMHSALLGPQAFTALDWMLGLSSKSLAIRLNSILAHFRERGMNKFASTAVFTILSLTAIGGHAQVVELEEVQGQQFQRNYPLEDRGAVAFHIPLPVGVWTSIRGSTSTTSATNSRMKEIYIASIEKSSLNALLYVRAKTDGTPVRWLDEPCKGEDFLYKNDYGMKLWDQRCLTIRQSAFLQNSNNKAQQITRDIFAKQGVKFEPNALSVNFTTYTRGGKYLAISIAIFPSNYGLDAPNAASPVTSTWHRSNYQTDPQKIRFLKDLSDWAEKYSTVLIKSFDQDKQQNEEIPAFSWK